MQKDKFTKRENRALKKGIKQVLKGKLGSEFDELVAENIVLKAYIKKQKIIIVSLLVALVVSVLFYMGKV